MLLTDWKPVSVNDSWSPTHALLFFLSFVSHYTSCTHSWVSSLTAHLSVVHLHISTGDALYSVKFERRIMFSPGIHSRALSKVRVGEMERIWFLCDRENFLSSLKWHLSVTRRAPSHPNGKPLSFFKDERNRRDARIFFVVSFLTKIEVLLPESQSRVILMIYEEARGLRMPLCVYPISQEINSPDRLYKVNKYKFRDYLPTLFPNHSSMFILNFPPGRERTIWWRNHWRSTSSLVCSSCRSCWRCQVSNQIRSPGQ